MVTHASTSIVQVKMPHDVSRKHVFNLFVAGHRLLLVVKRVHVQVVLRAVPEEHAACFGEPRD